MSLEFQLTFAGIPFVTDDGVNAASLLPSEPDHPTPDVPSSLYEEVDRMIPFMYLRDFKQQPAFPGRNLGEIAYQDQQGFPNPQIRIGDWYYPTGASRWSVFRGLATSSQAKAMLAATGGYLPKTFVMKAVPQSPGNNPDRTANYTLSTLMYMLPPRPLGEDYGGWDGLYLITLVDERYYFQNTPVTVTPTSLSTWDSLFSHIETELGITLVDYTPISSAYGSPETDSHLWATQENGAILLDALALNVGRVIVRGLDGLYKLEDFSNSASTVEGNRKRGKVVIRHAGGDIFYSGSKLPAGNLQASRNSVVPAIYSVAFPKYVQGDDPVPHFLNPRYAPRRPSCWYEDGYGAAHTVQIPVSSGGTSVLGLTGVSESIVHDTAKALIHSEASATIMNSGGLYTLASQMAQDAYGWQVGKALDEVYEGTVNWTPDGFHDILWTYSCRLGGAFTRVMKTEWNQACREYQHSTPVNDNEAQTPYPRGVGGPSLALNVRDETQTDGVSSRTFTGPPLVLPAGISGTTLTSIQQAIFARFSGQTVVLMQDISCLPTNERWVARAGNSPGEEILFNGTSGGAFSYATGAGNATTVVSIARRAYNGTTEQVLTGLVPLTRIFPNTAYGNNLITFGRSHFTAPAELTSGGIAGVKAIPQVQTIQIGASHSGFVSERGGWVWDGSILHADEYPDGGDDQVYIVERNDYPLVLSGEGSTSILGQFVGWSENGNRPVFLADRKPGRLPTTCSGYEWQEYKVECTPGGPGSTLKQMVRTNKVTLLSGSCPSLVTTSWQQESDLKDCLGDVYYIINYFEEVNFYDTVNFYEDVTITGGLEICGWMFWCCSYEVFDLAVINNWIQPTDTNSGGQIVYSVTVTGSTTELTGIIPVGDNQIIAFTNNGPGRLILTHNDPGSDALNRFALPGEASLVLGVNDGVIVWYDSCFSHQWKVFNSATGNPFRECGSLTWQEYQPVCDGSALKRQVRTQTITFLSGNCPVLINGVWSDDADLSACAGGSVAVTLNTAGQAVLGANRTPGTNPTWADIVSVTLPHSGVYEVGYSAQLAVVLSTTPTAALNEGIQTRMYDHTNTIQVSGSLKTGCFAYKQTNTAAQCPNYDNNNCVLLYPVTGETVIKLQARTKGGGGAVDISVVAGEAGDGGTSLFFHRVHVSGILAGSGNFALEI